MTRKIKVLGVAQCTCFTSSCSRAATELQQSCIKGLGEAQCTCFTSTNVQILTAEVQADLAVQPVNELALTYADVC